MGSRVGADIEASPVERADLVPRHPRDDGRRAARPTSGTTSVPIHWVTTKKVAGSDSFSSTGARILEVVAVAVVERDRQLAIRLQAALEPFHELPQRHDLESGA